MTRTVLAIPASSAAVEGLFSIASSIQTKRLSKLGDKTLNQLICLKNWGIKGSSQSENREEELEEETGIERSSSNSDSELEELEPETSRDIASEDELL